MALPALGWRVAVGINAEGRAARSTAGSPKAEDILVMDHQHIGQSNSETPFSNLIQKYAYSAPNTKRKRESDSSPIKRSRSDASEDSEPLKESGVCDHLKVNLDGTVRVHTHTSVNTQSKFLPVVFCGIKYAAQNHFARSGLPANQSRGNVG